jgi:hypothetical protein
MRVELPEGYVPPESTHPFYGYLTPDELEVYEAEEGVRLGIVPGVVEPSARDAEPQPGTAAWAPQSRIQGENAPETRPSSPPLVSEAPLAEAEEATVAHPGWTPEPPPRARGRCGGRAGRDGRVLVGRLQQQWGPGRVSVAGCCGGTAARRRGRRRWTGCFQLVDQRRRPAVPMGGAGAALDHRAGRRVRLAVWRERGPCSTLVPAREWRNGRRAGFRCQCPQGRGGSSPPSRTLC